MGIAVLTKKRKADDDYGDVRGEPFPWLHCLLMTALTGVAFGLRYWFNFSDMPLQRIRHTAMPPEYFERMPAH